MFFDECVGLEHRRTAIVGDRHTRAFGDGIYEACDHMWILATAEVIEGC